MFFAELSPFNVLGYVRVKMFLLCPLEEKAYRYYVVLYRAGLMPLFKVFPESKYIFQCGLGYAPLRNLFKELPYSPAVGLYCFGACVQIAYEAVIKAFGYYLPCLYRGIFSNG